VAYSTFCEVQMLRSLFPRAYSRFLSGSVPVEEAPAGFPRVLQGTPSQSFCWLG
jgi:hypothetical protein